MPHITLALIRKRSEHNEGMVSTLEEVALHQEELETIDDVLGQTCRFLKILLLQNNIIAKMENLHHMKGLEYLNLALNNVSVIEGLDRCEFLNKLDLTINFIDLHTLERSIDNLIDRAHLRELYMMGNPCEQDWPGFKSYVIARLPQLQSLDGTEITRSMQISAKQQLPALVFDLRQLAAARVVSKREEDEVRGVEIGERKERKKVREERGERRRAKEEAIESGAVLVEDVGSSSEDDDDDDEAADEKDELTSHCPETRVEMYRELAEQKKEKDDREKAMQPKKKGEQEFDDEQKASIAKAREREERGEIKQCNEGKWTFRFDEDGKKGYVVLDVGVQKHLSSSLIDVDVHPSYVSIVIKSKVLRLMLPAEVVSGDAVAQRSKTTGHLVISMRKVKPNENMIALRAATKAAELKAVEEKKKREVERTARESRKVGAQLLQSGLESNEKAVKVEGMVKVGKGGMGVSEKVDIGMNAVSTTRTKKVEEIEEGGEDDEDDGEPPAIV